MNFERTEEQQLLAESIRRFVERHYGFEARGAIVASREGWSRDAWNSFAELGLLGLSLPTEYGGFDGNALDQIDIMETIGEALIVEPYLSTLVGARLVARAGSAAHRRRILPAIVEGSLRIAFAHTESEGRYDLGHVATRAREVDGGFVLDGEKRAVLDAPCADLLVVTARLGGGVRDRDGIALFIIDPALPGVSLRSLRTLDARRAADMTFDGARIDRDARIAAPDGLALVEEVVDFAIALLCAEAVGAIRYANAATLEYLKTRKQFGVPIGSFQALQHRMVDMTIEYEQAKSMAALACATVDGERDPLRRVHVISGAKVRIADACRRVSQEAVQLHGGMGMSDELKLSHTFRRLTMIAQEYGDADHHLERFGATEA
jgi:alkylation response protein AidB-like acyl-CoA dehydrogenase